MAHSGREEIGCKWLIERWDLPPREGISLVWEGERLQSLASHPHPPKKAIVPGFINAHVHADFSHLIVASDLISWIKEVVKFRRTEKTHSSLPREESMVQKGTVAWGSIVSSSWKEEAPPPMGGSRVVFREVLGDVGVPLPPHSSPVSPHSPYALTPQLLKAIWKERRDSLKAIHLAESLEEVAFVRGEPNAFEREIYPLAGRKPFSRPKAESPVKYLEMLECLDANTIIVHSIFIDRDDVEILAREGASVVLCPRSNLYLSGALSPLPLLKEAGIPTALGTDGLGSTPNLSMWEEMRTLWFYARSKGWEITPQEILTMATYQGARILGLQDLTSLKPGQEASFMVIRLPWDMSPQEMASFVLFQGDLYLEAVYIKGKRVL